MNSIQDTGNCTSEFDLCLPELCFVFIHFEHGWAFTLCDLVNFKKKSVALIADQFHCFVHILQKALIGSFFKFPDHSLNDRKRHFAQRFQSLVVMHTFQKIHLANCDKPERLE